MLYSCTHMATNNGRQKVKAGTHYTRTCGRTYGT